MKKARDFRREARIALGGKWGTLAIISLIYFIITGTFTSVSFIPVVGGLFGGILSLLVSGPLSLGLAIISLNVVRMKGVSVEMLFSGFGRFLEAFVAAILLAVFVFLWSLLLVIPGIIKALSYSMTYYILADDPGMSANDARLRSMEMMRGNKWRLFCLTFSFIGGCLLGVLTLGILYLWVMPYMQTAIAAFYMEVSGKNKPAEIIEEKSDYQNYTETN